MEAFDYTAIDREGVKSKGTLSAPTARDARDMLRVRELTPIHLKAARAKSSGGETRFGRVKDAHLVQATRQLAILIGADQPVEESLKLVAQGFEDSPLRPILLDARTRVMEGARLSQALGAHPKSFDELYISMVASGEGTGTLGTVLDRLASDLENAQAVRRKVLGAIAYPAVITIAALLIIVVLMVGVVPRITAQFTDFGQDLPPLTKAVIGISNWIKAWGLIAFIIAAVGVFVFRQIIKRPGPGRVWSSFILRLPIIGRLARAVNAARFARITASLVSAGSAPLSAMETSQHTLTNLTMRDAASAAIIRIREGSSISRALARAKVFPPLIIQMVASGESTGDIAPMFDKSASYLEDEYTASIAVVLALLQPVAILVLAGIVLFVVAAIMLPMVQLNTLGVQ